MGQYKESLGALDATVEYYEKANSTSNLVRLHLSQGQIEPCKKICNA